MWRWPFGGKRGSAEEPEPECLRFLRGILAGGERPRIDYHNVGVSQVWADLCYRELRVDLTYQPGHDMWSLVVKETEAGETLYKYGHVHGATPPAVVRLLLDHYDMRPQFETRLQAAVELEDLGGRRAQLLRHKYLRQAPE